VDAQDMRETTADLQDTAAELEIAAGVTVTGVAAGQITRCEQPASGHRVLLWLTTQLGVSKNGPPCVVGFPHTTKIGETTVGGDGDFAISFNVHRPPHTCYFRATIRVDVLDGPTLVWRSPERLPAATVGFDHELVPGCSEGDSVVRVIDDIGVPVANAEVYVNGHLRGRTDNGGTLVASPGFVAGDQLVARKLVHQNATPRPGHEEGSDGNWNYHVYVTSLRVGHDANGDGVELNQQTVTVVGFLDDIHVLRVQKRNTLIGLNLRASIEWDATSLDIERYRDRICDLSELLYNATDGQMLVERVTFSDDRRGWNQADIRIFADLNRTSNASADGLFRDTGYINMNPNDAHYAGDLLHELGHYAFGVLDEYDEDAQGDPSDGPPCTLNSLDDEGPYGDGFEKDSCFMRGSHDGTDGKNQKKLCSMFAANPHAPGTEQGPVDCWSDLVSRFSDATRWRLLTPVGRAAIVGRLPDSPVPLQGPTPAPPPHDRPRSFVPLRGWKTSRYHSQVTNANLCDGLVVRARLDGEAVGNARVWLHTTRVWPLATQRRRIYQGRTRLTRPYRLAYDVNTGPGEIPLRGAHVGDRVSVVLAMGFLAFGEALVEACDTTVEVDLERFDIGPFGLAERLAELGAGRVPIVRFVWPGERTAVASADGALRLVLPDGSVGSPTELTIEERPDLLASPPPGYRVHSGPYQVSSSHGDVLAGPITIRFSVPDHDAPDPTAAVVMELSPGGAWTPVASTVVAQPFVASARVARLGAWLLAEQPVNAAVEDRAPSRG
jgi:hypothetical protein